MTLRDIKIIDVSIDYLTHYMKLFRCNYGWKGEFRRLDKTKC